MGIVGWSKSFLSENWLKLGGGGGAKPFSGGGEMPHPLKTDLV